MLPIRGLAAYCILVWAYGHFRVQGVASYQVCAQGSMESLWIESPVLNLMVSLAETESDLDWTRLIDRR
ncbi:uncharacterized protein VTP21DRAFT_10295 [Calcarisporiella thermophila]|uniref:uncharacterized protein n=1 Tax=Calcarisporiella thermophila TaxID=911321 RepID=UPI003742F8F0